MKSASQAQPTQKYAQSLKWGEQSTWELTSTNTLFNSTMAIFRPRHCHLPYPKINSSVASCSLIFSPSASNHLSGRNTSASFPQIKRFRNTPHAQYPIFVPSGTKWPLIVSPPGGTTFDMRPVTGGKIRKPSLITACRYGNALASESWIGDDIEQEVEALEISARSLERTCGLVIM